MLSNRFTAEGTSPLVDIVAGSPWDHKGSFLWWHFCGPYWASPSHNKRKLDEPRYESAHRTLQPSNRAELRTYPLHCSWWSARGTAAPVARDLSRMVDPPWVQVSPHTFRNRDYYQIIDEIFGSSILKAQPYVRLHDIGAFDDPRSQAAYIQQYFPPMMFQTPAWNAFLSWAWAWLRGRYQAFSSLGNITDNHNLPDIGLLQP